MDTELDGFFYEAFRGRRTYFKKPSAVGCSRRVFFRNDPGANAFNTREFVERKPRQIIEQIAHFLEHGAFLWPMPDETFSH